MVSTSAIGFATWARVSLVDVWINMGWHLGPAVYFISGGKLRNELTTVPWDYLFPLEKNLHFGPLLVFLPRLALDNVGYILVGPSKQVITRQKLSTGEPIWQADATFISFSHHTRQTTLLLRARNQFDQF